MNADKPKASADWLRSKVLGSFADDYEDLEMIQNVVADFAEEEELTIDPADVVKMIQQLISEGHAKAYSFERLPMNQPVVVEFQPNASEHLYFYVTDSGKKLVQNAFHV